MNLTADRLEVQKGERIRATLVGASWTVGASPHTANELEDVGFHVVSLSDTLPAGTDWQPGALPLPGFPQTLLFAELEAKDGSSYRLALTDDLTVARAWPAPPSSASSPLHPYAVSAGASAIAEGRILVFRIAYPIGRAA